MKINVLDKKVYNRISAGEVVERPFSVIKELVENSIDAGAKQITISIWNGGKDRIEIEDDGFGIEKSELEKALLPHATSKISKVSDLDNILTLGFRGEALASIASVAKVTILSKPASQEYGAKIYSEGGVVSEVTDAPAKDGTKITVDDLFFNTPVRSKFLKTSRAEEGDITDIVGRLILANPFIAFRYFVNDKEIVRSYGGGEEEAMLAVYGANTLKNCFKIKSAKNGVTVRGYIGNHSFVKPNRTYQTLIINGRYVINSTVSSAAQNAYQSYLMKRQYPFYVLYLEIPSTEVDVNVHPNKTDVRFTNNQIIYGAVYSIISKVLDGSGEALDIVLEGCAPREGDPINIAISESEQGVLSNIKIDKSPYEISKNINFDNKKTCMDNRSITEAYGQDDFFFSKTVLHDSGVESQEKEQDKKLEDIFSENKRYLEELERKRAEKTVATDSASNKNESIKAQTDSFVEEDFTFVGQAFKTYLIFQRGADLFFIDQHAAHERLLFDVLYKNATEGKSISQPLLSPYVLNLNPMESVDFLDRIPYLEELGFFVEEFGNDAYLIKEVPLEISDISLDKFFSSLLSDNSLKQEKIPDIIREKLCQRACKSAIKAGDELSKLEIDALKEKLKGNLGLKCPHGRPVAIRISQTEVEKWFKRIV